MTRRGRRVLIGVGIAMLALLAGGLLWLRSIDFSAYRTVTISRLEQLTGRDVGIEGDFDVALSFTPTVVAEEVTIANAPWGSRSEMLTVERLELEIQLLPLLRDGDILADRLVLVRPDLLLETGPNGQANWRFEEPRPEQAQAPGSRTLLLADLAVRDGRIVWHDAADGRSETVLLDRFGWQVEEAGGGLSLSGEGRYRSQPFELAGGIGTLDRLLGSEEPYPVDLRVRIAGAELAVAGGIGLAAAGAETALDVTVQGSELSTLGALAGAHLPVLGPYRAQATIAGAEGGELAASDLRAVMGEAPSLQLRAEGAIGRLLSGGDVDVGLEAEGATLAVLDALTGASLPDVGPFVASGRLDGTWDALALREITGRIEAGRGAEVRLVNGRVTDLLAGQELTLEVPFEATAPDLASLAALGGLPAPSFGPVTVAGTITGAGGAFSLADLRAAAGDGAARVRVTGAIGQPLAAGGLDLSVTAEGADPAQLPGLGGLGLPSEPFRITGHVIGRVRDLLVEDLAATLGRSDLNGRLSVALPAGQPPQLVGGLSSQRLDLDRLLGPAAEEAGEEIAATAGNGGQDGQLFEDDPLPLEPLRELDARLDYRAEQVLIGDTVLRDVRLEIVLEDGRLRVHPFKLELAGGQVQGAVGVEADQPMADVSLRLTADDVDVTSLLRRGGDQVTGEIDVQLSLDSAGRSLDDLMAELEGSASVVSEGARVEGNQLNRLVADLDILRILPPFWRRESEVKVNCLIGDVDIVDGEADVDAMLDTKRMTLLGGGKVDLDDETLDLELRPEAKSRRLSTVEVPVDIEGSLTHPEVRPRLGAAAGRAAAGVVGGLLVPLNLIASALGPEAVDACRQSLQEARSGPNPRRP